MKNANSNLEQPEIMQEDLSLDQILICMKASIVLGMINFL